MFVKIFSTMIDITYQSIPLRNLNLVHSW